MELIDQHTKKIMEGCKERAKAVGLNFQDETLEYIVSNRDLIELTPKYMIPTLYDYWVHDVEVLKEKGRYELYPGNPYETVINTRPAISFYNDNNPDWLNVMIFYHVLAHIDFFQNNIFFRHTWDYDFTGQALSDKRLIAKYRAEKGRFVDYIIEFARGIDNLVGYHEELSNTDQEAPTKESKRFDYYFDVFLQTNRKLKISEYIEEINRYNDCLQRDGESGHRTFFAEVIKKYPEFDSIFQKNLETKNGRRLDLLQYLAEYSSFLNKEENKWMQSILQLVRKTSIFFQPQIRTKIMNEGWASYWHEQLFLQDDRIKGHEVAFARVNSGVTSMPRVGLNPYALGMRLFYYMEDLADKGRYSIPFQRMQDTQARKHFDRKTGQGRDFIFKVRANYCDFMLINDFIDQDFIDQHKLFVAGKRLNKNKMVLEYYVKSRKARDYRRMLTDSLYHPPDIVIDKEKSSERTLYLTHRFEGKPLIKDFIPNTLLGIEYLWDGPIKLETTEVVPQSAAAPQPYYPNPIPQPAAEDKKETEIKWQRVLYTMENRKWSKTVL
ncbi:MAG: SpoVR family protein [Desulfobacteraceae bacterium]|nr:MAG: SpoVR family protein [Desulfobacteraceae bacterium]